MLQESVFTSYLRTTFSKEKAKLKKKGCVTYVVPRRAAVREDRRVAFTVRCRLQTLPSFNFGQKLRIISSGGHHVEGFIA